MESRPPAPVIHGMDAIAAPRVLVVDDEPQVVWVLRFGLESEGYDVATARNGVEALEQISIHRPELMVLDVMMPKMDGWTVLRELAKLPAAERPRVVMVTALASVDDKAKATALGADAYVPKPFDVDELLQVLHGLQKAS
jgi:two-component system, OmpR family, alkaline phosphatase synthesis response regulator PhoP